MENVFSTAYKSVEESPNKRLSLPMRRSILFAFGDLEPRENRKNPSKSKRLRAMLAMKCAKKIMPLWYMAFPEDHHFDGFISQIQDYINSDTYSEEKDKAFKNTFDDFFPEMESEGWKPEYARLALVWGTLIDTASVAAVDAEILEAHFEGADDEDMDAFDWDAAYMACMLYEGTFGQNEETVLFYRHSFWKWYIGEAEKLYNESR